MPEIINERSSHNDIALYFDYDSSENADPENPIIKHAARYTHILENGVEVNRWTSKMWSYALIGHDFDDLIDNRYGHIRLYGVYRDV